MGKDLIYLMTDLVIWANKHLGDTVKIPQQKKDLIESDPDKLVELTLRELENWEEQYLPALRKPT